MSQSEWSAPSYSAVRDLQRRSSTQDAIFQTFIHLTMGFVVIVALRPPAVDEAAMEFARLQELLQAEISRGQEERELLGGIIVAFGAQGLPRSVMLTQVAQAGARLRRNESSAVETLVDTFTGDDGPLSTLAFLESLSKNYAAQVRPPATAEAQQKARRWVRDQLRRHEDQLEDRIARAVAENTGTEPSHLFQKTRELTRARAGEFAVKAIARDFPRLVEQIAGRQTVDWSDLGATTGPARAPASFAGLVRGYVPPPNLLGLPDGADTASIDRAFGKLRSALQEQDEALAGRIRLAPDRAHLSEADLWARDLQGLLRSRLRATFQIPADETRLGPRTRNRLEQSVAEASRRELPALTRSIVARVGAVTWPQMRAAGAAAVVYDDHLAARRKDRTQAIRQKIGPAAGLPADLPSFASAKAAYDAACATRASALFDEQLALALRGVEAEIAPFADAQIKAIVDGSDELAGVARDDPGQAVGLITERFWKQRNISSPYRDPSGVKDHSRLLRERVVKVVADGLTGAVDRIVRSTGTKDLQTLRQMVLPDTATKEARIDQLIAELLKRSEGGAAARPRGKIIDEKIRAEFRRTAEQLYAERMRQLRVELVDKAIARAKEVANQLPPEEWKGKSDDRIVSDVLQRVLSELDLATPPDPRRPR